MNGDKMAGDDEAAAAILGMVEQYGTKEPENTRVFSSYCYDSQGEVQWGVTEYVMLASMPGNIAVLQMVFSLSYGKELGKPFLDTNGGRLHRTRAAALVDVVEKMLARRERLTSQIDSIKAEIAQLTTEGCDFTAANEAVVPHLEDVA